MYKNKRIITSIWTWRKECNSRAAKHHSLCAQPSSPITAHMLNKITRLYFISLSKQKDNVIKPQRDQNIDDTRQESVKTSFSKMAFSSMLEIMQIFTIWPTKYSDTLMNVKNYKRPKISQQRLAKILRLITVRGTQIPITAKIKYTNFHFRHIGINSK